MVSPLSNRAFSKDQKILIFALRSHWHFILQGLGLKCGSITCHGPNKDHKKLLLPWKPILCKNVLKKAKEATPFLAFKNLPRSSTLAQLCVIFGLWQFNFNILMKVHQKFMKYTCKNCSTRKFSVTLTIPGICRA